MRNLLCLLAILLASSSSALAFETCEECQEHIVAFGGLVNDNKADITAFLTDKYCPGTDDPDCANHVDELYPDMLTMVVDEFIILANWQICQEVRACNRTLAREEKALNCDDCTRNMADVRDHLTGENHIREMEHWLDRHYCTPLVEIPHCVRFIERHFGACHNMVMKEFMRPEKVCEAWGYC